MDQHVLAEDLEEPSDGGLHRCRALGDPLWMSRQVRTYFRSMPVVSGVAHVWALIRLI